MPRKALAEKGADGGDVPKLGGEQLNLLHADGAEGATRWRERVRACFDEVPRSNRKGQGRPVGICATDERDTGGRGQGCHGHTQARTGGGGELERTHFIPCCWEATRAWWSAESILRELIISYLETSIC